MNVLCKRKASRERERIADYYGGTNRHNMAPRLGSYSQPQIPSRREPLAETTDSSVNRQLATVSRKVFPEHKATNLVPRQLLGVAPTVASDIEGNNSTTNRQPSTASQQAPPDIKVTSPVPTRQPSTAPYAPVSENEATHLAINSESSTDPHKTESAVADAPIPHHGSVDLDVLLQIPYGPSKEQQAAAEKRISAIVEEVQRERKRNSATSQASTTVPVIPSTKPLIIPDRHKRYVGPWQLGRDLGRGATGRVRLARHRVTGHLVAMKIVSRYAAAKMQSQSLMDMGTAMPTIQPGEKEKMIPVGIEREIIMMRLLCHPNVLKLYDVWENRGEL